MFCQIYLQNKYKTIYTADILHLGIYDNSVIIPRIKCEKKVNTLIKNLQNSPIYLKPQGKTFG